MLARFKKILMQGDIPSREKQAVQKNIIEDDRKFVMIWSRAQLVYWGYCLFMSFRDETFTRCRGAYIMAAVLCLTALIFAAFLAPKVQGLILLSAFMVDAAILGAGLWAARMQLQHDSMTVVMFLAVVLVPIFFVLPPAFNIILLLAYNILAVFVLREGVRPQLYATAITYLIISSSIGIVIGCYVNKSRAERYVFAEIIARQKVQEKARIMFEQTADALAGAIDAKDTYTNGHSRRVAQYSLNIAKEVGMSEEECDKIYFAALLHDVGKIGIPIKLLQKKGKLTDEEFAQIKEHSVVGGEILSNIKESPWISIGARYHHERYNGRGYPEGLKGESIPEIARIIAVADAYDAMTSNRSYRNAIPQHIVREELVKGCGTQFDPGFAKVMLHLIDLDTEYKMKESVSGVNITQTTNLRCEEIYHDCSAGIVIMTKMSEIRLCSQPDDGFENEECLPTLIVFDSLDGRVHPGEENNKEILYYEYARIRLDGQVTEFNTRKTEVRFSDQETDFEWSRSGEPERGQRYVIKAVRGRDHVLVRVLSEEKSFDVILALRDTGRYVYIALSGEHCELHNIRVEIEEEDFDVKTIPRIAEEISYIKGPSGDLPNVQIDGYRIDSTLGIPVRDGMKISFHTMSLPTARLVWHTAYIVLFHSPDRIPAGDEYKEYALIRLDGENWESDDLANNKTIVDINDDFMGWDAWKEENKKGFDCTVSFKRDGNKIVTTTDNLGIALNVTTTIVNDVFDVYVSLTGDQCALTNIRINND